ncbi:hypothetical protein BMS3Abin16_01177 [archaeon BMS3Abin16]|nr:hypothetical protein BMS3Abin16_01177 [archaeon BMS3Abin16]GBE56131.1 hypothetical protein BMS3Bbin16_00330 [archaeon BMS3Bbin16]
MSELLQKLFESIGENNTLIDESLFTESEIALLTEAGIMGLEQLS